MAKKSARVGPDSSIPPASSRRVADGRIVIREYEPSFPEKTSAGGVLIPNKVREGALFKDAQGQICTTDKSIVYGVVTACGLKAERGSYVPMQEQGDFPLPPGTLVRIARANDWVLWPDEHTYNCCDLIEYALPGDPCPVWAPQE